LNEGQGHASFSVKINIYNTGSVVIQGSKCQVFYNKYFDILKELVHNFQDTSQTEETNLKTEITWKHFKLNLQASTLC